MKMFAASFLLMITLLNASFAYSGGVVPYNAYREIQCQMKVSFGNLVGSGEVNGSSVQKLRSLVQAACQQRGYQCDVVNCEVRPLLCFGAAHLGEEKYDIHVNANSLAEARELYRAQCPDQGGYCDLLECYFAH